MPGGLLGRSRHVGRRSATISALLRKFALALSLGSSCLHAEKNTPKAVQHADWVRQILVESSPLKRGITRVSGSDREGLIFSANDNLLFFEVDHRRGSESATSDPDLEPYVLSLKLMDASSGKILSSRLLPTRSASASLFPTVSGFLMKTGGRLKSISQDLQIINDLSFPSDRNSSFQLATSVSGKTFLLNEIVENSKQLVSHSEVYSAATFKKRYSWNEQPPFYPPYSISDQSRAKVASDGNIVVASFGVADWKKLASSTGRCSNGNFPVFINDRKLLYGCDKLIEVSIEGQESLVDSFPANFVSSDKFAVAENGDFVAIALDEIETKRHFLRESDFNVIMSKVIVYDLVVKKPIFELDVDPVPSTDYNFAFSPDGSMLAVLRDRNLSLYTLPTTARH